MNSIKYKGGYKYQLAIKYKQYLDFGNNAIIPITTDYISIHDNNILIIQKGYAWDGPSGPTIDTKNFMKGSLVHDALYQLMRQGYLLEYKEYADKLLRQMCVVDGMSRFRAWYIYHALKLFGQAASDSKNIKPILTAP